MNASTRSAARINRSSAKHCVSRRLCAAIGVAIGPSLLGVMGSVALAVDPTLPASTRRPTGGSASPSAVAAPAPSAALPPAIAPVPVEEAGKPAIPDAAAQAAASKLIDQVYREQIAASKTPEQKKQLSFKFLKAGNETTIDLPGKYMLLVRARDLAADLGDADTTILAMNAIEKAFAVEVGSADLETIARLNRSLRGVESQRLLSRYLLSVTNDAVAADKFDMAKKLVDLANTAASHSNEPTLLRFAGTRSKEVREVEAAYLTAKPALDLVAKGGTDPAQSLSAGRYKCLFKGDWAGGLPLLATGSDSTLKDLATKELAGVTSADQQLAVADAWWDAAEQFQGLPKNLALAHARGWYEKAEPSLSGLPKDKAAKRLKETESLAQAYSPRPGMASQIATAPPSTPSTPVSPSNPPSTPPAVPVRPPDQPPVPVGPAMPIAGTQIKLPAKFVREWKSPEVWTKKPEQVAIENNKVTIVNENGTVCKDEPFLPQKDGTMTLAWNYGEMKSGYEIWSMQAGELNIQRWNSKVEKDSGKPARRIGIMTK